MSLVTINDVAVITGTITMPLQGVWIADLVIDQPDGTGFDAGKSVTIKADGGVQLTGTVAPNRTGTFLDAVHVRVLAGAGGMAKATKARAYAQPGAYVRDVLGAVLQDAGETLSSTVASSITGTSLTAWSVFAQPAGQAIGAFLDVVFHGNHWRILSDGKFWTGAETWDSASAQFDILEQSPGGGEFLLGVDTPAIVPGCTIDGLGKINRVEHAIASDSIRTRVWTQIDTEDRGFRGAIASIVRQEIAGIDFYALYDARVDSQSADGATVDVTPADARLAGMQRVPLRLGMPGCVVKFATGTTVRIGWERGDPRRPFACLFQGGETVTAMELAGNTYKALLTSTLLNDLSTLMAYLATWVPLVVAGVAASPSGTAVDPGVATQATAIKVKIAANGYDSTVVKHG